MIGPDRQGSRCPRGHGDRDETEIVLVPCLCPAGVRDRAGTIEPGELAAMVGVAGDPLADASELARVIFVIKDGTVVTMP